MEKRNEANRANREEVNDYENKLHVAVNVESDKQELLQVCRKQAEEER